MQDVEYNALRKEYTELKAVYDALPDTARTTAVALQLTDRMKKVSGKLTAIEKAMHITKRWCCTYVINTGGI